MMGFWAARLLALDAVLSVVGCWAVLIATLGRLGMARGQSLCGVQARPPASSWPRQGVRPRGILQGNAASFVDGCIRLEQLGPPLKGRTDACRNRFA